MLRNLINYCLYSTWVPANDLWQKCEVLLGVIGWKNYKTANIVLPGKLFVVSYKQNFHPKNKSLKNEIYNTIYAVDNSDNDTSITQYKHLFTRADLQLCRGRSCA